MITLADLNKLTVIPYCYLCSICHQRINETVALGIRVNEKNYYFHDSHVTISYADWIHKYNSLYGQQKSI